MLPNNVTGTAVRPAFESLELLVLITPITPDHQEFSDD